MNRIASRQTQVSLAALSVFLGLFLAPLRVLADPPPNYYDAVNASTPALLRSSLHGVIDDHTRFPYTGSGTDTWTILEAAQQDPADSTHIIDVYRNASYAKAGGGNSFYDREHTWPKSHGFPNDGSTNYPYTDCHLLHLAHTAYNGARGDNRTARVVPHVRSSPRSQTAVSVETRVPIQTTTTG